LKSRYLSFFAATALCVFGTACAKKKVAVNPPAAPAAAPSQPAPSTAAAPAPHQEENHPVAETRPRYPDAATRARIDELIARIQDAYFDYDRHSLRDDAVKTLNADATELGNILKQYPDYKLQVQGYCDERGSAEYNLALGEARAKVAKDYLISVGVPANQLSTVSFGKEKQTCEDHDESCWAKNRRVHIIAMAMNR